jgi:hypothetical protein
MGMHRKGDWAFGQLNKIVGAGPRSPIDGMPEFVIYGCDATMRPFVAYALTIEDIFGVTTLEQ